MGAARPSAGVAALNGSFVEFDGSGALGQERLLERVLIPAPTSSYAYRGEPTYLCKRCIFYLAACRAVSEVSSHKDRCALRW